MGRCTGYCCREFVMWTGDFPGAKCNYDGCTLVRDER